MLITGVLCIPLLLAPCFPETSPCMLRPSSAPMRGSFSQSAFISAAQQLALNHNNSTGKQPLTFSLDGGALQPNL